jgi:flagellar biosynthesis/type III secretory pathway M-ring protein FliF/YscJ
MMRDRRQRDFATDLFWVVGLAGVSFYVLTTFVTPYLSSLLDPDREKKERASLQAKAHIDRLRESHRARRTRGDKKSKDGPSYEELNLNEYENLIALEMVAPADIPVGFSGRIWRDNPSCF